MNLEDVKDIVWEVVEGFFSGASVVWAEQTATMPTPPYVTLKVRNPRRTVHVQVDDEGNKLYSCSATFEMNLFTKGKKMKKGQGTTVNYSNTAISDLADFFIYLDSDEGLLIQQNKEITMELDGDIQDLSSLENSSEFRYRSMADIKVSYIQNVGGSYGLQNAPVLPNVSGGGIETVMRTGDYVIEEAEIEEEKDD